MLTCLFIVCSIVVVQSVDVTFRHVTVMGGSKPIEILASDTLSPNIPDRKIRKIYFADDDSIPILFTDSITDLDHLEELDLSGHDVQEIKRRAFNNLPVLSDLNLDDNRLEEITSGIFNHLPSLTRLSLSRNSIANVWPSAFDKLHNLNFLFLADNRLKTFDANWFKDKPFLFVVDLHENEIEDIPDGAFEVFQQSIFLGNNQIQNLSRAMFGTGRRLQQLSLHDNDIEGWDEDLFDDVFVGSLDVVHNKIECLHGNLSEVLVANYISLGDNPWNCSCLATIVEFKQWADEKLTIDIDLGTSWEACNDLSSSVQEE